MSNIICYLEIHNSPYSCTDGHLQKLRKFRFIHPRFLALARSPDNNGSSPFFVSGASEESREGVLFDDGKSPANLGGDEPCSALFHRGDCALRDWCPDVRDSEWHQSEPTEVPLLFTCRPDCLSSASQSAGNHRHNVGEFSLLASWSAGVKHGR